MIKINIPNNNLNERKYIIEVLFNEFLGLQYKLEVGSENLEVYEIELLNSNILRIEDHFFNKFPNDLEYLKLENIPTSIDYAQSGNSLGVQPKVQNQYIVKNDIPIIYGTNKLETKKQKTKIITCGIDIFASSFFMLTRWEEYINRNRDSHDRFPAIESLAFKNNFLDRPIINEYIEMLWNMLLKLGVRQKRKARKFELLLTHDVDNPLKYPLITSGIKEIIADILKRKNIKLATNNLIAKAKTHLKLQNDPYDTFDWLMGISERIGVKSYFFFMASGCSTYDNMYKSDDPFIKKLVKKIKQRNHFIGIHPTYNAYNDFEQLHREKTELEHHFDTYIKFGREHYLRFEVPTTWQIWEDNGMSGDSTCSYADKEGFRCGVCYEYSVFNILTRKKLNLKERPLIVMEGSFVTYQPNIKPEDMESKIIQLISEVKKYNGEFVFLWHNSSFNTAMWKKYKNIYEKVVAQ